MPPAVNEIEVAEQGQGRSAGILAITFLCCGCAEEPDKPIEIKKVLYPTVERVGEVITRANRHDAEEHDGKGLTVVRILVGDRNF